MSTFILFLAAIGSGYLARAVQEKNDQGNTWLDGYKAGYRNGLEEQIAEEELIDIREISKAFEARP